ncbi:MAG TPA: LysR family transcriptional regulator [Steroidobacteraceae bacterium]
MDLRRFDLNLLKTLDALLEERNVTHAAQRLFITQQAASGALQRLREHFEDQLLTAVGRHLELTPLAVSLIHPVRDALLAAKAALDTRPSFDPGTAKRNCRIAMSDYGLIVVLPGFLRRLAEEAPGIRCTVKLLSNQSFNHLDMGELDFCVASDELRLWGTHRPGEFIRSEPMFEDDFVCVVDPRVVDVSQGISLSTYQQLRHNSVAFGEGAKTLVEETWIASKIEIDVAVTAFSFSALLFMLPGTPLIATAQRRLANILAPRLGLVVLESPLEMPRLRENLMWHERSEADPAHIYLRQTMEAAVADLYTAAAPA